MFVNKQFLYLEQDSLWLSSQMSFTDSAVEVQRMEKWILAKVWGKDLSEAYSS